jgi:hypothetical protein
MRRRLCAALVVLAVLWTGVGLSVLAISAHEHLHHAEPHDHHAAVEVALHGHAHDGPADHDHDLTGPVQASRDRSTAQLSEASLPKSVVVESELHRLQLEVASSTLMREHGPPAHLLHCVLLV